MATKKSQRIGIIVILVALVVGTFGSFAIMILAPQNQSADAAKQQEEINAYQAQYREYQDAVSKQAAELSDKYYPIFSPYASRVGAFDMASVTSLKTEDLLVGDGAVVTGNAPFAAYYIGWNPKGKVFDQSIDNGKLKAPFALPTGIQGASVIQGWIAGLEGMRIGGVRELTIPSDQAYGETGQGDDIPPNTPLKFVVMVIEAPAEIPAPEYPESLLQNLGGAQ